MTTQRPRLARAIPAAGAVIVTACAGVLFAAPANAAPTITFNEGVLAINGDAAINGLVVGSTAAHTVTLNGTEVVVLGEAVPVADVQVVRMDADAGKDTLIFNGSELAPPTPPAGPGPIRRRSGLRTENLIFHSDVTNHDRSVPHSAVAAPQRA